MIRNRLIAVFLCLKFVIKNKRFYYGYPFSTLKTNSTFKMEYLMFEKTVNLLSEYVEVVTDLRKETGGLLYRGVNPNDTFIMLTKGDSMDPTIKVTSENKA
jgi:hypothetical protein